MSSNTNDPYVPALSRHIFTAGGCSSGSHEQPSFNESSGAFTESWDGYVYVPQDINNCVLKVSADDNAQFYLDAFPENIADLPGRGPAGGGNYASAESSPIQLLKKGYYRAHVSYENIDYPTSNIARLEVLLNGTQITIGQLETHNLLTQQQAQTWLSNYTPVNYDNKENPKDVWTHVGGGFLDAYKKEVEKYTINGVYDEAAHKAKGSWYHTCALRVSVALAQSGIDLEPAQVTGEKGEPDVLPPEGYAIVSASRMTSFFATTLGCASDFHTLNDYKFRNPGQDIICFGGKPVGSVSNHVGICQGTDGTSAGGFAEEIWILYRPTWGEPKN